MSADEKNEQPKDSQNPFKIYYYIYWIYIFTGNWRFKSNKKWKKYLFLFYQMLLFSIYFVNVGLFIVDSYILRNELPRVTFNMTSTTIVFTTFIKTTILKTKRSKVEYLLDQLENHFYIKRVQECEESKQIFIQKAKFIRAMMRIFYTILGILNPLRVIASAAFYSGSYIIPIPCPEKFEEWYKYIFIHQVFIVSHFMVTLTSHDMLIYGIIIRLIAHYEVLEQNVVKIKNFYPRRDFERFVPGYKESKEEKTAGEEVLIGKTNDKENVKHLLEKFGFDKMNRLNYKPNQENREDRTYEILQQCISHHQILLKHVLIFNVIYNIPLLVQASGTVILLGIVALHTIFASSELSILLAQQILYVIATTLNIFWLCSFGSYITSKSRAVADALYDTPWYEMNIKNRKTILFTMKKFIQAPKLRGGGMVVINRKTFLKLIQLSYNMVAVMKNAY